MEKIRINKYLSEKGICSRREADRLLANGKIQVNGQVAVMGVKVNDDDTIVIDGKPVCQTAPVSDILLAFNKPRGIVCTAAKDEKNNIVDYIHYPERIYPIGRLDKDSEGLILMTNQGELVNGILKSRYGHQKEYIVNVDKKITDEFIENMKKGVFLSELDVTTKPCKVKKTGQKQFRIILTQGLNRQIRRMCQECGYEVTKLVRVRIMNIALGGLASGTYREVTQEEYEELKQILKKTDDTLFQKK